MISPIYGKSQYSLTASMLPSFTLKIFATANLIHLSNLLIALLFNDTTSVPYKIKGKHYDLNKCKVVNSVFIPLDL